MEPEGGKESKLTGKGNTGQAAELVIENEDGSVILQSFIPAHLINHLRNCLTEGDYELLYDQLLSDEIKQAYISRGRDPHEMLTWFEENQRDLLIFLTRASAGISAPHIVHSTQGNKLTMSIYGRIAQGLRFKTAEMIQANGQFRLYMIR